MGGTGPSGSHTSGGPGGLVPEDGGWAGLPETVCVAPEGSRLLLLGDVKSLSRFTRLHFCVASVFWEERLFTMDYK